MYLQDGRVLGVVSREARLAALADAETVQERCGGFIDAQSVRVPTEIPGEMVTTLFVVTWRDRTDAKDQPEQPSPVAAQVEDLQAELEDAADREWAERESEADAEREAREEALALEGDDELPEIGEDVEDESAIPASAR